MHGLKVKGWKNIFQANTNQKRTGVTILKSEKIDFKSNTIIGDKEEQYILVKGLIHKRSYNSYKHMTEPQNI